MDKSQKIYFKALKKYNNGYIDKAMELCEESISINIKNRSSINLKGLIMYLKGKLDTAQKLWKMNYEVNKDKVSKKYLESSKDDVNRLNFYKKSLVLIKKLEINEAIDLLENCSKSSFNTINVNNYLAVCYIKKGQYTKALDMLDNVFKIDVKNKMAADTKKNMEDINVIKKKFNMKKVISIVLVCIIVIAALSGIYLIKNKKIAYFKSNKVSKAIKTNNGTNSKLQKSSKQPVKIKNNAFPYNNIKSYIENKNYDEIYNAVEKFKNSKLSANDKILLSSANDILVSDGVEYFYEKGCAYIKNGDYTNAKKYLKKAVDYGKDTNTYPDIIYMMGYSLDSSGDVENAIKYYSEYDGKYSDGDYESTVLYRLVIIYNKLDKNKAKNYAEKLSDNYPSSIYNNSIVKAITDN